MSNYVMRTYKDDATDLFGTDAEIATIEKLRTEFQADWKKRAKAAKAKTRAKAARKRKMRTAAA